MCDMMAEEPIMPHCKPVVIRAITMTPVPLFNKQRHGCRPFCEIYVGDERVLTTSQEYDRMKYVVFFVFQYFRRLPLASNMERYKTHSFIKRPCLYAGMRACVGWVGVFAAICPRTIKDERLMNVDGCVV